MRIERLHEVLARAGLAATPREVAETLWLAAHLDAPAQQAVPVEEAEQRSEVPGPPPEPTKLPRKSSGQAPPSAGPAQAPREPRPPPAPLLPEPARSGGARQTVLAPTAPMLADPLALQRALRPLKRRIPSRRLEALDEPATAEAIADQPAGARRWVPVMEAVPERWLDLVVVADTGPSMRLWRPLVRELHTILTQLGTFRDVRTWRMVATRRGMRLGEGLRDPATLIDPAGRRIVLVVSDCSGPHWWDGRASRALRTWAVHGPAAILQPLPDRLWHRTAAPTVPVLATTFRPGAPNTELSFVPYEGMPIGSGDAVPVPVLEITPDWVADWARLVAGTAGDGLPAALTFAGSHVPQQAPRPEPGELTVGERVMWLQATASPEAARLAAHLAVSVPVLPVMRLVQAATLPSSRPSHLAEVILSGLLRPSASDENVFEFLDGAREALLKTLPRSTSWHTADVLRRVSGEIEARAGSVAERFRAYLQGPEGGEPGRRAFGLVSPEAERLLRRVGVPVQRPVVSDALREAGTLAELPAGTVLCEPGRPPDAVTILLEGIRGDAFLATETVTPRAIADFYGPGALIAGMALSGSGQPGRIVTRAPVRVLRISPTRFAALDSEAVRAQALSVGRRLCRVGTRLALREVGSRARVAAYLLELGESFGTPAEAGEIRLGDGLRRREFADWAGVSRSFLTRLLNTWREQGVVTWEPRRLIILDPATLAAEADGLTPVQGEASPVPLLPGVPADARSFWEMLPTADRDALAAAGSMSMCSPGTPLPSDAISIVFAEDGQSGMLAEESLSRSDGRPAVVRSFGHGDIVGFAPSGAVTALRPVRVLRVPRPYFETYAERNRATAYALAQVADQRLAEPGWRLARQSEPTQGRLIGRRDEQRALEAALDAVEGGAFRFVAVAGDSGMGKTRLLDELSEHARRLGIPTYSGRATEFEQHAPFGAVADALGGHFPDLTATPRDQVRPAMRELLEDLADPFGLVLLLDDVHWSDDATVRLLEQLIRRPPRARLLLVVAYQPAAASARLAGLAEGVQIALAPLSRAECGRILGVEISEALYEAVGGNPLYLDALVGTGVPEVHDLETAVLSALRTELSEIAPLVAQAAAIAADEVDPLLVAATAEVPVETVREALDELVTHDVMRRAGDLYTFRHPLVRHAASTSAAAGWRLAAHARIAEYLAAMGKPATARAAHVERAARAGDRVAVATLVGAARAVARYAPDAAAHWLRAAVRIRPGDHELQLELANLHASDGQFPEAIEAIRGLLRTLPADAVDTRVQAVRLGALVERMRDRSPEGRSLLLAELRTKPDPRAAPAALLRVSLVSEQFIRGDFRAAQAVLDLMPETRADWTPGLTVAVAALRPMAALGAGRIGDAIGYSAAAGQRVAAASDQQLAVGMDAITWLCWADLLLGRCDEAFIVLDRAIAVERSPGNGLFLPFLLAGQARADLVRGHLDGAAVAAEGALEAAHLLGARLPLVTALTEQCLIASWSGDHTLALASGAAAQDRAQGEHMSTYAHAVAKINSGALDAGVELLAGSLERLDRGTILSACELLASAEAGRGRVPEAEQWANRAVELAHPDLGWHRALARLALAHAAQTTNPVAAADHAEQASIRLRAAGRRLDAARALLRAGICAAEAGNRHLARNHLRTATASFAECGAGALVAEGVRAQRRIGVRVAARAASGGDRPYGLSPRESEVAGLVAEGLTNLQIAERLFLSVRTVETHLARVFAKLGVSSRVSMVSALGRPEPPADR